MIEVKRIGEGDPLEFEIMVRVGNGQTRHHVTMARDTCERLTAGTHTPERCIEAAFQFLLDREPKESILRRFDVTVISRYFPEFERDPAVPLLRLAPNDAPAPIAKLSIAKRTTLLACIGAGGLCRKAGAWHGLCGANRYPAVRLPISPAMECWP